MTKMRSVAEAHMKRSLRLRCLILHTVIISVVGCLYVRALAGDEFSIAIKRTHLKGEELTGTLFINGREIGPTLENDSYRIPPGTYNGVVRYISSHHFVQNPGGELFYTGDFLLEIAGVKDWSGRSRTGILFHAGSKPQNSEGCVLLGAVTKDSRGEIILSPDHPLYKLRESFYGTNDPNSSPNKTVKVEIVETIDKDARSGAKNGRADQQHPESAISGDRIEVNGVVMARVDKTHLRFENLTNTPKSAVFDLVVTNPFLHKDEELHTFGVSLGSKEQKLYDYLGWTIVSDKLISAKP